MQADDPDIVSDPDELFSIIQELQKLKELAQNDPAGLP
jgi:hypothetical protein